MRDDTGGYVWAWAVMNNDMKWAGLEGLSRLQYREHRYPFYIPLRGAIRICLRFAPPMLSDF